MVSVDQLIQNIGAILFRAAKKSALHNSGDENHWDYGVFVYQEGSGDIALFYHEQYISYLIDDELLDLLHLFEEFRGASCADADKPFLKCKTAIRQHDRAFKMLFEFDDNTKWHISPANLHERYEILLGDIFPETLEASNVHKAGEPLKILPAEPDNKPNFLKRFFGFGD